MSLTEPKAGANVRQSFNSAAKTQKPKKKYPAPLTYPPKDEEERQKVLAAAKGMSVSEYIRQCVHVADIAPKIRKTRTPVKTRVTYLASLPFWGNHGLPTISTRLPMKQIADRSCWMKKH